MFSQWALLLLCTLPVMAVHSEGCQCPGATILDQFPSVLPAETCCLNYSGSTFGHVPWARLTNGTRLQLLDLSHCNITQIDLEDTETTLSPLQEVYLGHNRLTSIPGDFLSDLPSLKVLELGMNQLRELPEDFLQGSDGLRELDFSGNLLRSLPISVLSLPGLARLELGNNTWDCSCSLVEGLEAGGGQGNNNNNTSLQGIVGNITCASPGNLAGWLVWSVATGDVCRSPGLTALFIVLPLLILTGLVLCLCCGRKSKSKEAPAFGSSKKKASHSHSSNGHRHHHRSKPPVGGGGGEGNVPMVGDSSRDGILKSQLLLRSSTTLLSSTRDIYEEVEMKLGGSVECLPSPSPGSSFAVGISAWPASQTEGPEMGTCRQAELDTVSVTEVMKDSADREKAYMTQSTEYYSLVPGIDLEDSDHDSDHG
ncbi:leucine-rich repeat, immunoglobulin-like domain and transmembrane domain-containing protein 1 [Salmo salar]|uniref:leucine-rich repeat, immunoglobulin-like domain and transmembrane domain-containing protein 1 n=1 Tax=Salmo salar TaxID=8030 RepID=UPI0006B818B7|nr:leucine-rich repeat, immunoglobulin-like domain and transmembrane domain-containing protein 1 [Salmo salar]|eukprot:XP_013996943.1 PREDICTED: leucine-rich repeat, immunoglobulin-like domain and transmembrane domain-containing protein 1 [Salmo salar]